MTVRLSVLAVMLASCDFRPGGLRADGGNDAPAIDGADVAVDVMVDAMVDPTPWLAGYTHRKTIIVRPGGAAASLTDIPIGIRIAADADLAAFARSDGADLVVTASDGTTVRTRELVSYTSATGAAELWVKLPTLQLDIDTTLYLYFGGAIDATVSTAVWSNGLMGVWHMSSVASELDSTSHANNVTQLIPTSVPGAGPGVASRGAARAFDGVNDRLEVLDPIDGSLDVGTGSFSISIWLYSLGTTSVYDQSIYKGGTNGGNPGYTIFNGSGGWQGKILDNTTAFTDLAFSATPIVNRWVHCVMVIDRDNTPNRWRTYVDGVPTSNATFNLASFSGSAPLYSAALPSSFTARWTRRESTTTCCRRTGSRPSSTTS